MTFTPDPTIHNAWRRRALLRGRKGFSKLLGGMVAAALVLVGVYVVVFSHAATVVPADSEFSHYEDTGFASSYDSFIGHRQTYVEDFNTSNNGWECWESTCGIAQTWQAQGRTLVFGDIGLPGTLTNCTYSPYKQCTRVLKYNGNVEDGNITWAKAASGAYDAHVVALANTLVANGQSHAVIRLAHEFNCYCISNDQAWEVFPNEVTDFKTTFQRWSGLFKSVPGQHFVIMFNPTSGQSDLSNADQAWPGDQYVDMIGLDTYDQHWGQYPPASGTSMAQAQAAAWNLDLNGDRGLAWWHNFAVAHGNKPIGFPEWGNWSPPHGGGDNASFIQNMYTFMTDPANNVQLQSLWEYDSTSAIYDNATHACNTAMPNACATYKATFGAGTPRGILPGGTDTGGTGTPTPSISNTPIPTVTPTSSPAPSASPASTGAVDDTDPSFVYSGSWLTSTGAGKYDSDDHYTSTTGDSLVVSFTGTQIKFYGAKNTYHGIAAFKIDSGAAVNVDYYGATRQDDQLLYTSGVLTNGRHTLTITNTGTKNAASGGTYITADQAEIVGGTPTPTGTYSPADIDHNGHVDIHDLSALLGAWGASGGATDINGDGKVDVHDLSALLAAWTG